MTNLQFWGLLFTSSFQIRHDGSNSYRLMQLGCLESVANSTVAYSSSSPLTYSTTGTEFASPYFSTNHQYTPLHHQSFHYEFQHSHPAVNPDAYSLNSLHHSQQYYQQIHHGEPTDFINLHNARALKSSCLDEQRRELGCLDAYRRHDLSLMSHGSQYGMHPDQRLLPGPSLGLAASGADDLQVNSVRSPFEAPSSPLPLPRSRVPPRHRPHFPLLRKAHTKEGRFPKSPSRPRPLQNSSNQKERKKKNVEKKAQVVFLGQTNKQTKQTLRLTSPVGPCVSGVAETVGLIRSSRGARVPAQVRVRAYQPSPKTHGN